MLRHPVVFSTVFFVMMVGLAIPAHGGGEVDVILANLMAQLGTIRDQAVEVDAAYRKAEAEVAAIEGAYRRAQVDPRRVAKLRVELERMEPHARSVRSEIRSRVNELGRYRRRLMRAYPERRADWERFFGELTAVRRATEELCRHVIRQAPRKARELGRLMSRGFGSYLADPDSPPPRSSHPIAFDDSSAEPTRRETVPVEPSLPSAPPADVEPEKELEKEPVEDTPDAVEPTMPPLWVDPLELPDDRLTPEERRALEAMGAHVSQPTAPAEPAEPAEESRKKTTPTTPSTSPTPAVEPESQDDDFDFVDDFVDIFGGFETEARLPTSENHDEESDLDHREERFRLFADRIAEEFQRSGVVEQVGSPPLRTESTAEGRSSQRTFAERLDEQIRGGSIPTEDEIFRSR